MFGAPPVIGAQTNAISGRGISVAPAVALAARDIARAEPLGHVLALRGADVVHETRPRGARVVERVLQAPAPGDEVLPDRRVLAGARLEVRDVGAGGDAVPDLALRRRVRERVRAPGQAGEQEQGEESE